MPKISMHYKQTQKRDASNFFEFFDLILTKIQNESYINFNCNWFNYSQEL